MIDVIGRYLDGRVIYSVKGEIPVFGYIALGVIDRGTNVLQVRPTTICPQACVFCSVDSGLRSSIRWGEFIVHPQLIISGVKRAIETKGCSVEILLDTIGDVLTYPWLIHLISELKKLSGVKSVALETHGLLLTRKLVDKLDEAGLDRVNLSIETFNQLKARYLYRTPAYDTSRVIETAEYLVRETSIDLHVTPLWLPGLNDDDIVEIINWAVRIGAGKRWPPVTIQKFIKHKYGRGKDLVSPSWREFWRFVDKLERETIARLRWNMREWGMHYAPRIPCLFREGDLVEVKVISRGWLRGEYLGLYMDKSLVAVVPSSGLRIKIGENYITRILKCRDHMCIGRIEK